MTSVAPPCVPHGSLAVTDAAQTTREPQYQRCLDVARTVGTPQFGLMSGQTWHDDPRRLVFQLARYKFVAKMLSGQSHVLEVGCADAFASRIVRQEVARLTAIDFDPLFVENARAIMDAAWKIEVRVHDMLTGPLPEGFDGAFALDVLEHIAPVQEHVFVRNLAASLTAQGVLVIGTPSLTSQSYASPLSRQGHANCKTAEGLRELLRAEFRHVFLFSMNDEVVHTGFYPLAHYLLALCCSKRGGSVP
jgi:Methyltransferase domain